MRIIPDNAAARLREGNDAHEPKGTPDRDGDGRGDGGQFAKKDTSTTAEWTVPDHISSFLDDIDAWGYPNPIGVSSEYVFDDAVIMEIIPKKDRGQWYAYLTGFRSFSQGQGTGSKFLQKLTGLADKHKVTMKLVAEPLQVAKPMKKTPRARLVEFYKRFGFVRDESYAGRMFAAGNMVRHPKG
jgi:GNAT superfamily N-acetyltransferase